MTITIILAIFSAAFIAIILYDIAQDIKFEIKTRRCILQAAISMYHRDVKRYGGDIFVMPEDIYSGLALVLPWNWRLCRMMPEAKFRIIESYI